MNPLLRTLLPYAAVAVVAGGGFAWYTHTQREIGRRDVLLHQADSAKAVDDRVRRALADSALRALESRDSVVRLYRQGVGSLKGTLAKSDSARGVLVTALDSAHAALADTAQTVAELRTVITGLVDAAAADTLRRAAERQDFQGQLARANAALISDSVAIAVMDAAHTATKKSLQDSEDQVKILRKQMPSGFWRWTERAVSAGAIIYFASKK